MSLVIRRISVENFRKFRTPVVIEGLTDGLNVVIEPNETGKSTLLDALRAAFFVRFNTRNQLAQSFAPHGDSVGPEVQVAFEVDGAPWSVTKHFLRSASVEVSGPQGRAQGEEAEARLNALLGSVRDTSRGGDVATYGALGLLWVAQAEALSATAPGQIVRDTITSTLEAEVGSIIGGAAYRRVRDRVEAQYDLYWTPTGHKRGRQIDAYERLEAAEVAAREAADRLATLERSFSDLDAARARLKIIQREMADNTDVQTRSSLIASLDIARVAAQILTTRRAEQEAVNGKVKALADVRQRHDEATQARMKADAALTQAREQRLGVADTLSVAKRKVGDARTALDSARTDRQAARMALAEGEERIRQSRRGTAIQAARQRHADLLKLEEQRSAAKALADTAIAPKVLTLLEEHDRAVAEAQAVVNAGATRIALSGSADGITIDDQPMALGARTLDREVHIRFGTAELQITPPVSAASAAEVLASALRKRKATFDDLGVVDLAAARASNEIARDAAADLRTLEARIESATPADDVLQLPAGSAALKLFVAELGTEEAVGVGGVPDIAELTKAMETADSAAARAEGAQDSAIEALRRAEQQEAPLATAEARAASDVANAVSALEVIERRPEWPTLTEDLAKARELAAEASVKVEDALRDASAHDVAAIARKIELIDARVRTAGETRTRLETDIARLEGTIESEGGLGLADRTAAAYEEVEAARIAFQRVTDEAQTLKALRSTLDAARNETSAKFVGPVAARAKRHIERLLPGCELTFSEDLGLESVIRAGVNESCASLSRGTQEQLAVLTRIAFADMLLEEGKPVSLILDDPLVYSDDARLDTMIEILSEAATRMQVVILTCRDRAFRHVAGNRIAL
ncbi:AAA family ATPase [Acetobacter lambici]|uniref:AAA family ATPase n=1 Tax=Acetobacter lambici TaxID=1332824 RepID=A0ABT1F3T1_9PROT|nr:AAA family ATPase [Acetobacter lambici]MCP1243773.1 AAA family ATPase [Acetobacter lambici]MCP1259862.1 AAA family ATPase [Acetobacter lambici]NHO58263.1 AAA family ATPase [Acetobacter lambici]